MGWFKGKKSKAASGREAAAAARRAAEPAASPASTPAAGQGACCLSPAATAVTLCCLGRAVRCGMWRSVIHGVSVPFAWQVVRRNDDESTLLRVPLLRVPLQWQLLAARGAAQPPEAASLLQSLMKCSRSIL